MLCFKARGWQYWCSAAVGKDMLNCCVGRIFDLFVECGRQQHGSIGTISKSEKNRHRFLILIE